MRFKTMVRRSWSPKNSALPNRRGVPWGQWTRTLSWKGREVDGIKEAAHKGEMHVSRPAVETLFVRLSGSWTLQSKVPMAAEL
jgi:hypothetical protein